MEFKEYKSKEEPILRIIIYIQLYYLRSKKNTHRFTELADILPLALHKLGSCIVGVAALQMPLQPSGGDKLAGTPRVKTGYSVQLQLMVFESLNVWSFRK